MIIVPEIEKIVLLVPRCGSTSILSAVKKRYPSAIPLYRHMEADGVPYSYDKFQKVAVIRDPLERLWSLYKYMKNLGFDKYDHLWVINMRRQTSAGFEDWVLHNQVVFTYQYDFTGTLRTEPFYAVLHPLPENRKSQFVYARPDLGTKLYRFDSLQEFADDLDIEIPCLNGSYEKELPSITDERVARHLETFFEWDYKFMEE